MKNQSIITPQLIDIVKNQLDINWHGTHGISHWSRVYAIGMRLAGLTGASQHVIELFALLHDCRRLNEYSDPNHGPRAATFAATLHGTCFPSLGIADLKKLEMACSLHTKASSHDDITVQTCFDSDRLDLGRIGKMPKQKYISTHAARDEEIISWAYAMSIEGHIPDNILGEQIIMPDR